jgi:hypothetical protein
MWEPMLQSDLLVVERQRNERGWIVRAYFLKEVSMDLAFVPDPRHEWSGRDPEMTEEGGFFRNRLWPTPSGWLHLTLRESPPSLALTFMPN